MSNYRPITEALRDDWRERALFLYCPQQGGWQSGVWFDGRWTDFATLTMTLEPIMWMEPRPDLEQPPPEQRFASHLRFG